MKKSFLLTLLMSFVALASSTEPLPLKSFQDNEYFDYVHVEQAERVFWDELVGEELYKVTYKVEGECASAGEFDACELITVCEYVWVEDTKPGKPPRMTGTDVDCSEDIETVLNPVIIDDY